jgi:tryptophan-rich sensory protein
MIQHPRKLLVIALFIAITVSTTFLWEKNFSDKCEVEWKVFVEYKLDYKAHDVVPVYRNATSGDIAFPHVTCKGEPWTIHLIMKICVMLNALYPQIFMIATFLTPCIAFCIVEDVITGD